MNHRQRCSRGRSIAMMAGALLSACHPSPPGNSASTDAVAANDARLLERAQEMRVRAANAPGSAAEASELASHVTTLYTQGVAKRRALSSDLLGEALACLDRARQSNPDDPELLVRKGELLVATGQRDAGSEALRQSIAVRPTLRGFNALEKIYAANNRTQDLTALCRRTLPAMKSDESRYAVLDNCLEHSGANTAEVGLAWASPKDRSFYKVRRREVETRLNAAKQQKAKDDLTAKPTAKQSR